MAINRMHRLLCLAWVGLMLCAVGVEARAVPQASGRVFLDANGNGALDDGEKGIEGVAVSNGREVVVTDSTGYYELPVRGRSIIRVTKPAGYAVPTSENRLARFYYVHDPRGSPEHLRYAAMKPTGTLPEAIHFPLQPTQRADAFQAILMADPQPQSAHELGFVRDDVINELVGSEAAFGLTVGDMMYDDLSLLPRYNRLIGQIGIPWWHVPGNHDVNRRAADNEHALATYKQAYGPPYYSFEYGAAHFVVLNNVHYSGREGGGTQRRLTDRQIAWLRNDLAEVPEERLVVVAMHIPLASDRAQASPNQRALLKALEGYSAAHVVAAHRHAAKHVYFGAADGFEGEGDLHHQVLGAVSGSWWSGPEAPDGVPDALQRDGTPNGYYVLDVEGTQAAIRFKAARRPPDYQMRVRVETRSQAGDGAGDDRGDALSAGRVRADRLDSARVWVNLFNGGPRSSVAIRVDSGRYRAIQRVEAIDPFVKRLYRRYPSTIKPVADATPSPHLWQGELPDELSPGTYTLSVRATDAYGRTHTTRRVLEITDP